jgi:NIPSNAP
MPNAINMRVVGAFLSGALLILGLTMLRGSNKQPSRHVYELRMYHVSAGKMDALKARFADHTDAIFARHNMKSVGYWQPEDAPGSQNLFVYLLEHPSREAAKKNWDAFHEDPEWKKVKVESEKDGPLTDQIDSYFMDSTGFSKLQ